MSQMPASAPRSDCNGQTRTVGALLDVAADLAGALAVRAVRNDDAQLARLATDALTLATDLHALGELLATIAGLEVGE